MSEPTALRVDYEDADDLLKDYAESLSSGGYTIASARELPIGSEIRLALSFPGLLEPIRVRATVQWSRGGDEPQLGIALTEPAALEAAIARIRDRDPAVMQRVLRILVVEDNPHVAELLRHAFNDRRNLGPKVLVECRLATDGKNALDELQRRVFDLLIVDIYLPGLDGAKLISLVRAQIAPRMPIIAVSAGGESAQRSAMNAGANIFIDKPMRLRGVIETMRAIMKLDEAR